MVKRIPAVALMFFKHFESVIEVNFSGAYGKWSEPFREKGSYFSCFHLVESLDKY